MLGLSLGYSKKRGRGECFVVRPWNADNVGIRVKTDVFLLVGSPCMNEIPAENDRVTDVRLDIGIWKMPNPPVHQEMRIFFESNNHAGGRALVV
jgi:hypothetical protein